MLLSEFPFYALSNEEFIKETGAWVHDSASSLLESRDLFKDIIASPEKTDNHDIVMRAWLASSLNLITTA